jgi:hypothetical protein
MNLLNDAPTSGMQGSPNLKVAKHPPDQQTKAAKYPPETINNQYNDNSKASASEERRQSIRHTMTYTIRMRWMKNGEGRHKSRISLRGGDDHHQD